MNVRRALALQTKRTQWNPLEPLRVNGHEYEPSPYGPCINIQSRRWRDQCREIRRERIVAATVNSYGLKSGNLNILTELPFLEAVEINSSEVADLRPLNELKALRAVSVWLPHGARVPMPDWAALPNLEYLSLSIGCMPDSVFACKGLRYLRMGCCPMSVVGRISRLKQLQAFSVIRYPASDLAPLSGLSELRWLEMDWPRIRSLRGLEQHKKLEVLRLFSASKYRSIAEVAELPKLRWLAVVDAGTIESLAPIEACSRLRVAHLGGRTVIQDGDMSPLAMLKRRAPRGRPLNSGDDWIWSTISVLFANRRHYSHKWTELADEVRTAIVYGRFNSGGDPFVTAFE